MALEKKIEEDDSSCTECGKRLVLDTIRGEAVCEGCGLVEAENLPETKPERGVFDHDRSTYKPNSRGAGEPRDPSIPHNLQTVIWISKDAKGRPLSSEQKREVYRIKRQQTWAVASARRNETYARASAYLDAIAARAELPTAVKGETMHLYYQASSQLLLRGRCVEDVVAALTYMTCRLRKVPRTLTQIAGCCPELRRKDIGRTYRTLKRNLKLKIDPTAAKDYLSRACSDLNLPPKVKAEVKTILKESNYEGSRPTVTLAATIHIACNRRCGEPRTLQSIAAATDTTVVGIKRVYKELITLLGSEYIVHQ